MTRSEYLSSGQGDLTDHLFSTGMILKQRTHGVTLTAEEVCALGDDLIEVARQLRAARASVRALTDELLAEEIIEPFNPPGPPVLTGMAVGRL
ncbi:MAG: hypothetical protein LKH33_10470 [Acetobacter sp.]|jgi:hypothetical protein|nr:hypothetical protein [Acetobacter sp.]MCH4060564.1 hypothetical protein [Acetobacter sp.]MCH4087504.1 hypothetical protein [Acetobacter sp.]MCI1294705.1 hypothetical protein [Acetobacter sp.]MCI1321146.1 hypothetical protein [Acetobacter sp.]